MRVSLALSIAMALGAAVLLNACSRSAQTKEPAARQYDARGIVRGFAPDRTAIDVEHEDIPGFMPAMTMPFVVRNRKEIADLKMGDAISFRLNAAKEDWWIDNIKRIDLNTVPMHRSSPTPASSVSTSLRLREGDVMPPFQLTNQNDEIVSLETFRGRPFVLTFIFTRCPMPNFCPLISNHFAELQSAIKSGAGATAEMRLLSITLDPAFDQPNVLKNYGGHLGADPRIWTFATGEISEINRLATDFSVYMQAEGGTISHGLATVLIDQEGKISKIWRGNGWKPADVIRESSLIGGSSKYGVYYPHHFTRAAGRITIPRGANQWTTMKSIKDAIDSGGMSRRIRSIRLE